MDNDVLARARWRKSSRSSGNGACVEVADLGRGAIAVRDSKNPDGPVLLLTPAAWSSFTGLVKDDAFS